MRILRGPSVNLTVAPGSCSVCCVAAVPAPERLRCYPTLVPTRFQPHSPLTHLRRSPFSVTPLHIHMPLCLPCHPNPHHPWHVRLSAGRCRSTTFSL